MKLLRILALIQSLLICSVVYAEGIVTIYEGEKSAILKRKADAIEPNGKGLKLAKQIAARLKRELKPMIQLGGLSAPQIGISKQVFVYSWDRTWKNVEVVINPQITDRSAWTRTKWEACISTIKSDNSMAKASYVETPKWIEVAYMDLQGEMVRKRLYGFAVRIFMHEYEHLQGIMNVDKKDVKTRTFYTIEEYNAFVKSQRRKDKFYYQKPHNIDEDDQWPNQ